MNHVMLFDLLSGGHHARYIGQLAERWEAEVDAGRLDIVAPEDLIDKDDRLADIVRARPGIRFVPIRQSLGLVEGGKLSQLRNVLRHGRLLRRYVEQIRPDHCLLMYFDQVQLPLALGLRFSFPVGLSGIYFRPSFHYAAVTGAATTLSGRAEGIRKRTLLLRALSNPHLSHLFCLDPLVVPFVPGSRYGVRVVVLPDGVESRTPTCSPPETRASWGIDSHRSVLLFFGSMAARKGIYEMIEALKLLPDGDQRRLALAVVGAAPGGEAARLEQALSFLRSEGMVQVAVDNRFVPDAEIPGAFAAADLVLLPYRRHVGSSGVLVRAAQAQVPVLSSDYGLLGEQVRRHALGKAVNSSSPATLAEALMDWLHDPGAWPFDAARARRFAAHNTAEGFARTILDAILTGSATRAGARDR